MIFYVQGEPLSKARPRFTKGGRTFTPKVTANAETRVVDAFKAVFPNHEPLDCQLKLVCHFYLGTRVKRDLDNQLKLVCDALNGIAWIDDHQISEIHATRTYLTSKDDIPGVQVSITRADTPLVVKGGPQITKHAGAVVAELDFSRNKIVQRPASS